jgi:hypothetical protein
VAGSIATKLSDTVPSALISALTAMSPNSGMGAGTLKGTVTLAGGGLGIEKLLNVMSPATSDPLLPIRVLSGVRVVCADVAVPNAARTTAMSHADNRAAIVFIVVSLRRLHAPPLVGVIFFSTAYGYLWEIFPTTRLYWDYFPNSSPFCVYGNNLDLG